VKTHNPRLCKATLGYACAPLSPGKGKQTQVQTS
jgi:hypothetical protein